MSREKTVISVVAIVLGIAASSSHGQNVWYVDDDAPRGGDGTSWHTAFRHLQDALASAASVDRILVAGGMYRPDVDESRSVKPGDRSAAFHVVEGVTVSGGYAGFMASDPQLRDLDAFPTILTGDLHGDDGLDQRNRAENSYDVVIFEGEDVGSRLDGLSVLGAVSAGALALNQTGVFKEARNGARRSTGGLFDLTSPSALRILQDGRYVSRTGTVVLRVDENASGPQHDGTSWCDAFVTLQDAMAEAAALGGTTTEIRIADGTYRPDEDATTPDGSGDRDASFVLMNGLVLRGGYAGCGAVDPNERDLQLHETILSGDLAEDDGPGFTNRTDNSHTLVLALDIAITSVLDGLTITSGYAMDLGGGPPSSGAGVFSGESHLEVVNCTFRNHAARSGGAAFFALVRPSSSLIVDSAFINNFTLLPEGAVFTTRDHVSTLINCVFLDNEGELGAGMGNAGAAITLVINSLFSGNHATRDGGAIWNVNNAHTTLINSTISGNTAAELVGGVASIEGNSGPSNTDAVNTIFWENSDSTGNGEFAQIFNETEPYMVNYSCVQGWSGAMGGTGNTGADPLFVDANGPDDAFGTADDDVHVWTMSPVVDAGDNSAVPAGISTDLEHNPRFIDDVNTVDSGNGVGPIVDMGVYEVTVPRVCGDQVIQADEQCDEGGVDTPTCDGDCTIPVCGDGHLNLAADEVCDDGTDNSNIQPDACRLDCTLPRCGDTVTDTGEECDDGPDNSDIIADACRTDCTARRCGDSVIDSGEECDEGPNNSDVVPDVCRTTCTFPRCGDGTIDTGEECDSGVNNSDTVPDSCRTNCRGARCGDGVMDAGELCDHGPDNSDVIPDACRTDCTPAQCGDKVVDSGEECDGPSEICGMCHFDCSCIEQIPTVSEWGLGVTALLLLTGGKLASRLRWRAS